MDVFLQLEDLEDERRPGELLNAILAEKNPEQLNTARENFFSTVQKMEEARELNKKEAELLENTTLLLSY